MSQCRISFDNILATIEHFPDQVAYERLRELFLLEVPGAKYLHKVKLREALRTLMKGRIETGEDIRNYATHHKDRFIRRRLYQFANEAEEFRIQDMGHFLASKDAEHGDDGYVCLVSERHRFLTGILPMVVAHLEQHGHEVQLIDNRIIPPTPEIQFTLNKGERQVELRPYQLEAVNKSFTNSFGERWWPRGVLKIATGGGKTETAIAMYQMTKVPTVFLVHRKDLLNQTAERFAGYGVPVGVVGDGEFRPEYNGITIATMQTLWSTWKKSPSIKEDWFDHVQQVFFDEAHLMAASLDKGNTFVHIANLFENAYMRWGLTATPFMKGDDYSNQLLLGVSGQVLYEISNDFLIKEGYLTPPLVKMVNVVHKSMYFDELTGGYVSQPTGRGARWAEIYDFAIVRSVPRNRAIIQVLRDAPKPCLLLLQRTEHIRYLEAMAAALQVPFPLALHGGTPKKDRVKAVTDLRAGRLDALVATTIFDEGIDIPELRSVIMAGGGKSHIKALQRTGRGLRIADGKDRVVIYDFLDASIQTPTWLPLKHSKERRKFYKAEKFEVEEVNL